MDTSLEAAVEAWVREFLPNLDSATLTELKQVLINLGVSERGHLSLVERRDIEATLRLPEIRMRALLKAWQNMDQAPADQSNSKSQPVASTSQPVASTSQQPSTSYSVLRTSATPVSAAIGKPPVVHFDFNLFSTEQVEELKLCEEKKEKININTRKAIVHVIGNAAMRQQGYGDRLTDIVNIFSCDVALKFRYALADIHEEKLIGDGFRSLFKSVYHFCENFRRGKRDSLQSLPLPKSKRHHSLKNSHPGALRAQDEKLQENYREVLVAMHSGGKENWNFQDVTSMMTETFLLQRNFLNQSVGENDDEQLIVIPLKEKWPFLFEPVGASIHFNLLEGCDINSNLESFIPKIPSFIKFMTSEGKCGVAGIAIETKLASMQDPTNDMRSIKVMAAMQLIALFFKESISTVFPLVDSTYIQEDVEQMTSLPITPCLVCVGPSLLAARKFFLFVDKTYVSTPEDFLSGLKVLFCSFYVLNIAYPPKFKKSLDLFQRLFVGEINTSTNKVHLKIMNDFSAFDKSLDELLKS